MTSHLASTSFDEVHIHTVSIDEFIAEILPPVDSIIDFDLFLHENLGKLPVAKNNRLWGYSTKNPSQVRGRKTFAYKSLALCTKKLSKVVGGPVPSIIFRNNDASVWDLQKREDAALPDSYFIDVNYLNVNSESIDWNHIFVAGVYSKHATTRCHRENTAKIMRYLSQCMHHDARRRFVYGFSIADSIMTLWYCDRAQVVVSEKFDFIQDWRILFRFLLSVMYAGRERLGFDPTMTLLNHPDGTAQYDITIRTDSGEELVYRTLELLSSPNIERPVGRGTRVWKAVKVENGTVIGDPVALKDCWVDGHREREGNINARIRSSATLEVPAGILPLSLMTVLCHGDVFVSGTKDSTRILQSRKLGPSHSHDTNDNRTYQSSPAHQIHYRIVFREIGRDLEGATSLVGIFRALMDAAYGLMAMHVSGWVHGDISPGNIFSFEDWAKIGDLEHATREGERSEHDGMTTDFFASAEVRLHNYIFRADSLERSASIFFPAETSPAMFIYNPLHDLESLWWIAVYVLVANRVVSEDSTPGQTYEELQAQRQLASDLFWEKGKRTLALKSSTYFRRELHNLHPSLRAIASLVDDLRESLVTAYLIAERDITALPSDFDITQNLHMEFGQGFCGIAKVLEDNDIEIRPL